MAGFFNKIKNPGAPVSVQTNREIALKKKDDLPPELTPLEKMLLNAGPLREDGTDRFFGFENFGNTCYCNSIVQALFYSDLFRESVINFPLSSPSDTSHASRSRVPVTLRPPMSTATAAQAKKTGKDAIKSKPGIAAPQPGTGQGAVRPEDKPDTPEYKKKQAMIKGPILELVRENSLSYGMDECTFTGLKDIFLAIQQSNTRTGVLSPQRFLEIFKRDNEMFRNSMHQDAHEFYGVVLNDVIANVESNARKMQERLEAEMDAEMDSGLDSSMDPKVDAKSHKGLAQSVEKVLGSALMGNASGYRTPGTGWVHDIFEGLLTSETKCLTCETASQRDETFLDLSIDLEEHSSVTACLRKFSAEEMLCERNKFHCDHCGGLHEAEKRMKVKRLPKVLTLHLKRFKYTEDYSRLQKLFHRVVYPYHLRMFNTTDDAEDQDRLYELYAVVVHIGGNAYHGHYVSIIKTKDRGWVLFDDEMVEPVDKHFVRNFFGDKPGMATAYVLFYQETTFDKVREEQEREGMEEVVLATLAANVAQTDNGDKSEPVLRRQATQPMPGTPPPLHAEQESLVSLTHAHTMPTLVAPPAPKKEGIAATTNHGGPVGGIPKASLTGTTVTKVEAKTRDELKRERREREAVEKAAKMVEKEREKHVREEDKKRREEQLRGLQARRAEHEEVQRALDASKKSAVEEEAARKREDNGQSNGSLGFLERSRRGSRSMTKRSFSFFNKEKHRMSLENVVGDAVSEKPDKVKGRLSMGLGRKKSSNLLA